MIHLPKDTIQLLTSSQIITCSSSLVKELVENAIDAEAEHVEISLEKFGLDKVEVVDNGNGIPKCEISQVCQRYCTTKLTKYEDLAVVKSYGFRGEALHSICTVAKLEISTCTPSQEFGEKHIFDGDGNLVSSHPISMNQGTRILITNLFSNVPVRKQVYSSPKKGKEEIKNITNILYSYKIAHPSIRFTLKHDKRVLLQLPKADDLGSAITLIYGSTTLNSLNHTCVNRDHFSLNGYIPCSGKQPSTVSRSNSELSKLIINKRPANGPKINSFFRKFFIDKLDLPSRLHPIFFLHLNIPQDKLDINASADKGMVMLHDESSIIECIEEEWEIVYAPNKPVSETADHDITNRLELLSHSDSGGDVAISSARDVLLDTEGRELADEILDHNDHSNVLSGDDPHCENNSEVSSTKEIGSLTNFLKPDIITSPRKSERKTKQPVTTPKQATSSKKRKAPQSPESSSNQTLCFKRPRPDRMVTSPSLVSIRENVSKATDLKSPIPVPAMPPSLIGCVGENTFIFYVTPSLYIGNTHLLQEQSTYTTLLLTHQLEACSLDSPLVMSDNKLTMDLQLQIEKLQRELIGSDLMYRITEESVVKNGFDVRVSLIADNKVERVEIIGLASLYEGDGVHHLVNLLNEMKGKEEFNSVFRTEIVQEHLKMEAKRLSQGTPVGSKLLQQTLCSEWEAEKVEGKVLYTEWYKYFKTL